MELYSEQFFRGHRNGSYDSAREVVPLLLNLVPVQRAIDVGCGTGTWLSVLKAQGVDVLGIDGPWVTRDTLEIPPNVSLSTTSRARSNVRNEPMWCCL